MWIAVGVITAHAQAADGTSGPINQEAIVVSLPVFIVCLIATASFTWAVARWDAVRTKKVEKLEAEVRRLLNQLDRRTGSASVRCDQEKP